MIDGKYYLVSFDHQTGHTGLYNIRIVGLVDGQFSPLDCPSGKSLSVTFFDPLGEGVQSVWVSDMDNCELIEVCKEDYELYKIYLEGEE